MCSVCLARPISGTPGHGPRLQHHISCAGSSSHLPPRRQLCGSGSFSTQPSSTQLQLRISAFLLSPNPSKHPKAASPSALGLHCQVVERATQREKSYWRCQNIPRRNQVEKTNLSHKTLSPAPPKAL